MNKQDLINHLKKLEIALIPIKGNLLKWETHPIKGYRSQINSFKNLKDVERHWKLVCQERLAEIETANRIGADQPLSEEEICKLITWAKGELSAIPHSLRESLEREYDSPFIAPEEWRGEIIQLSARYGCVAFTWLHEAVLHRVSCLACKGLTSIQPSGGIDPNERSQTNTKQQKRAT